MVRQKYLTGFENRFHRIGKKVLLVRQTGLTGLESRIDWFPKQV